MARALLEASGGGWGWRERGNLNLQNGKVNHGTQLSGLDLGVKVRTLRGELAIKIHELLLVTFFLLGFQTTLVKQKMYIPGLVCLVLAATVKAFRKKQKNDWQACPKMITSIDSVRKKTLDGVSYEPHFKTPASGQSGGLQKGRTRALVPCKGVYLAPLRET